MKIVLAGGTGQLGRILTRHAAVRGENLAVLTRNVNRHPNCKNVRHVNWDARTPGVWCNELEGADVVINLAGRSVDCRYHAANRTAIVDSRVDST